MARPKTAWPSRGGQRRHHRVCGPQRRRLARRGLRVQQAGRGLERKSHAQREADGLGQTPNDQFGSALLISGDTILIGAFFDNVGVDDEGSAYVFVRPAAGWSGNLTQNAKLIASDASPDAFFGTIIAQHGDTIVVGAPDSIAEGGGIGGPGAAYVSRSRRRVGRARSPRPPS